MSISLASRVDSIMTCCVSLKVELHNLMLHPAFKSEGISHSP